MNDSIITEIRRELREIERNEECSILYACESGSRAWGFASPDSDYDVRFIYTHGLDWKLDLRERRDTIEHVGEGLIDLSEWELSKTLRLFAGCNLALNEWLLSPTVYAETAEFVSGLRGLIPSFFNPKKAIHHYLATASSTFKAHASDGTIGIKKLFYILRPLLAARWSAERLAMPPMTLAGLLEQPLDDRLRDEIAYLLGQKAKAVEQAVIEVPPLIGVWIEEQLAMLKQAAAEAPVQSKLDWDALNAFYRRWLPLV